MPQQRLPMRKIRDVLRLTASGMSSRPLRRAASFAAGRGEAIVVNVRFLSRRRVGVGSCDPEQPTVANAQHD